MTQRLLDGTARRSTSPASPRRSPGGCSPTSAPTSCSSSRPAVDPLAARAAPVVARGPRASTRSRSTVPTTPRSTRCSPTPTSCIDTPGLPRRADRSIPAARPHAVWVSVTPFGLDRPARRLARVRPRRDGGEREHVRTGDPDRAPVRCTEPSGYAHTGGRGRVRGADRALRPGARSASTCRCRRSCSSRTWRRRRGFAADGVPGPPARREHRPHPRDLADARRLRVVRPARRQGARPEPRDPHEARRGRRHRRVARSMDRDWSDVQPEPRTRRGARARSRQPIGEYFAAPHDAGALRHRVRDQPDARAGQLAARDPRQSRSSTARDFFGPVGDIERFPRSFVHRARPPTAKPRRSARAAGARAAAAASSTSRPARTARAERARSPGRRRRGTASRSSSSGRARPGRSRRATSSSTARPCCASSRRAGPTSCASTRSGPTTRTASRARRCTTGSTSASATSRST